MGFKITSRKFKMQKSHKLITFIYKNKLRIIMIYLYQ